MSTGESNVLTKFVGGANEIFVVQVREVQGPAPSFLYLKLVCA